MGAGIGGGGRVVASRHAGLPGHGHIATGGHGGWETSVTTVPGVFVGPDIRMSRGVGTSEDVAVEAASDVAVSSDATTDDAPADDTTGDTETGK